jgi:hypothetical protein
MLDTQARHDTRGPTPYREFATRIVDGSSDAAFALVTDPAHLPSWNQVITNVVEAPETLVVGSAWRVQFHTFGFTWVSRSEVTDLDATTGWFAYRSQTDDGNPSYAEWQWRIRPDRLSTSRDRSVVTVGVALHPLTFWRAHLLMKMRRPLLRREMQRSLIALEAALGDVRHPEASAVPPISRIARAGTRLPSAG